MRQAFLPLFFWLMGIPLAFPTSADTSQSQITSPAKPEQTVVLVARENGKLVMRFHPDPAPGKDPLRKLDLLYEKFGSDYSVITIVDSKARIEDLWQVEGTAAKAPLNNVRTFILYKENGKMSEFHLGKAMPYSLDGPFDPNE